MRGDENRVVDAFCAWLESNGWSVEREVEYVDVVATRDGVRLYAEAKGRTEAMSTDVDTMYGQILRRMPFGERESDRFAVVVPTPAVQAALRVSSRVRALLRISVFEVTDADEVREVG